MIIWKDIKGLEGYYQVSNIGTIRSLPRIVNCLYNQTRQLPSKTFKVHKQNRGYLFINVSKNNKPKNLLVHRLVAEAFLSNPHNFKEVNHKDGNKENNNVDNLEWCTASYNKKHMYDNLLSGKIKKITLSKRLKNRTLSNIHKKRIGNSHRGIKSVDAQPVRYLKTGEIFGSIKELSRVKNLPFSTLQKDLSIGYNRYCEKISREDYLNMVDIQEIICNDKAEG